MSQKITLSKADLKHLPKIKALLLQGKNQLQISIALNLRRETVNRKIRRWMQTDDFELWLKEVWLDLYSKVTAKDPVEAFRQVSRMLGHTLQRKRELVDELNEIVLKWQENEPNTNNTVQASQRTRTIPQQ